MTLSRQAARRSSWARRSSEGPTFTAARSLDGLDVAAEYLGLHEDELRERIEDGQSLAEIARTEGKSVDGLEQALLDEVEANLDEALEDEELTRERADEILEQLREHIDDFVNRDFDLHGRPADLGPRPEFFGRPA
jgi:hypothetical protein